MKTTVKQHHFSCKVMFTITGVRILAEL